MIDSAFFTHGRWHRRYYHDPFSAEVIARTIYPNNTMAVEAAFIHILLDDWCSYNPDIKKMLEKQAKEYYRKMRLAKKQDKFSKEIKISGQLTMLVYDLKRILQARRLYNQFRFGC